MIKSVRCSLRIHDPGGPELKESPQINAELVFIALERQSAAEFPPRATFLSNLQPPDIPRNKCQQSQIGGNDSFESSKLATSSTLQI